MRLLLLRVVWSALRAFLSAHSKTFLLGKASFLLPISCFLAIPARREHQTCDGPLFDSESAFEKFVINRE
jgi:hypothetical protein